MRIFSIIAAVATLFAAAPASAQSVKAGIEAWQRGEHAKAVAIWQPLADQGDADAAFNLGQAYRLGRGAPIHLSRALVWLTKAAEQDHLDAQATLGLLLFQNGDQGAAMRWLKAAAERGEPRAALVYGTALFNGDGLVRDPVLGYAFVSRAAAQELAPARATLAEMDKLIPLEQRRKGVAIALAQAVPKPAMAAVKPAVKTKPASAAPARMSAPVKATAKATASGVWRVQLGAFGQRGSAEALFRKLAGSGALAGRQPYYVPAGAVTRLQAGPFESRAAAAAACAALARSGQPCFPVAAR